MAPYKTQKPGDVLSSERERALAAGVRRLARDVYHFKVGKAFEEVGCTCHPYRDRLKELVPLYEAERKRVDEDYQRGLRELDDSDLGKEILSLKEQVRQIDLREHPTLDAQGRQAYSFLPVWLLDQVRDGNYSVLELGEDGIARAYAQGWMEGWRPRLVRKERRKLGQAEGG